MGVRSEARFLRDQGKTLAQIGEALGVSRQAVHKLLKKDGPDRPRQEPGAPTVLGPRGLPAAFFDRGSRIVGLEYGEWLGAANAHWRVVCGGCGREYVTTGGQLLDLRDRCATCAEPGREPAPVSPRRGRGQRGKGKKNQVTA